MGPSTPDRATRSPAPAAEPSAAQRGQLLTETKPRDLSTAASAPGAVGPREAWTWFDEWAQDVADALNRMRVDEAYRREIAARAK